MCRTGSHRCLTQHPQQKCEICMLRRRSQALTTCLLWILRSPVTQLPACWLYQGHPRTCPLPLCTACLCHKGQILVVPCPQRPWDKTCRVLATSSPPCSSYRLPCLLSRRSVKSATIAKRTLAVLCLCHCFRLPVQHHSVLCWVIPWAWERE